MRVKRYIVDTMPDAMLKIRNELGADAVILSTKDMKVGGFLGMFCKKKIEVIAATESNSTPAAKGTGTRQQPPKPAAPAPVARRAVPEAYRKSSQLAPSPSPAEKAVAAGTATMLQEQDELPMPPAAVNPASAKVQMESRAEGSPISAEQFGEAIKRASALGTSPLISEQASPELHKKEEALLEEIRQMKLWMSQLAKKQGDERELPPKLLEICQRLTDQEVSPEWVEAWVDEVYDKWMISGRSLSDEDVLQRTRETIQSFLKGRVNSGIGERTRIVYIAGPTGVGKTTTIAKLAADQIFRLRKKVGFITADTYRISAVEQLRTYASILNVPMEVVQSPGDVQRAMQRLEHCDLILMDTAGRNYLNELFVAELHSLLTPSDESETYLVLSLTSKTQDMKRITEHFSKYDLTRVIFTKLDETESYGPIYNLLGQYPLQVCYLTNGQNVPDDLLQADEKLLVDILLGEQQP
ncbi:flagellar biosynthesis protein FlhF [Paenibacillus sanguinis]|uniref:flagellar biosynthesis protein FlhF n=1 Tax=Paenibacillus sanguinis TaxID=225906 RepID=UPI00036F4F05|nr:flagellar biosynthesis protein FlhF [Paenibacillus sanguinis]